MKILLVVLAALHLAGCADLLNPPPRRDPNFAPARAEDMRPVIANAGSIFQPGYEVRLFEDTKARHVGDVLTIHLTESTKAQKDGETKTGRTASATVEAPVIMGYEVAQLLGGSAKTTLEASNAFNGKGASNQSNALNGYISVTVVEVLPNGNLRVRGEKRLGLNQGNEYVKVSGIVRPVDIDTTNTVESSKVADATMIYNGDGVVTDTNRMGWLQRFFNSVLFPF